jgi:hypothetical protein
MEVSWNEFVRVWRQVEGKGLTYGQSMVAAGPIWHDPELKQEFINKHIHKIASIKEETKEPPKPEEVKEPVESKTKAIPIPSSKNRDAEYYRIKAKYYKRKAAK